MHIRWKCSIKIVFAGLFGFDRFISQHRKNGKNVEIFIKTDMENGKWCYCIMRGIEKALDM